MKTTGLALGLAAVAAVAAPGDTINPYSPSYGHPYRHGVVPTREVHQKMKAWEAAHASTFATSTNTLYYGGGTSSSNQGNVGVANSNIKVYLVFYGSGWGSQSTNGNGDAVFSGDPDGAAPVTQEMFKGIGTGGELWSADLTQWCQGIASGSSSCPTGTSASSFVPYMSGGILAGVWEDTSASTPINADGHTLALEAIKAAQHFGNTTPASNRYAYYVIMSAHGDDPDNYQSPTQGYCAWHDWNGDTSLSGGAASSSVGDIAFSNQPYNMDMGSSCGVGFVNSPGTLDGWTMTLGHEWHETASDYFPAGGWTASSGQENSDECAWIAAGSAGGAANVAMGTGTFTEQASWSNDTNNCAISHAIVSHGGTVTVTANNGSVSTAENTAVNGTLSASDSAGNALSFSIVANPSHGTVTINNLSTGAFTYTPAANYSGSDSFTFKATDSVTGTVSNTATESETVTSTVNATPTAGNGSVTTTANTAVSGTLSASDTDGDALSFAIVASPVNGTVTITNSSTGAFTYTPNSGFSGSDSFTFHATDSAGNVSNTATESVTVNSVANATPTASNGTVTTTAGTAVKGTLSASDTDGDALTFAVVANPGHGTVSITNTATGAFTYTPASGYSGSDSFTFHATDSVGNVSNTATESVTVNPVSSGCPTGYTKYTGSISQGYDVYEPNNNYYHTSVSGYNSGVLSGPSGTDFDLYLWKWNSSRGWQIVASSTGPTSSETINYYGGSGYYEWDIYAYSGSGNFQFCLKHP
ncbi:MAG TPA: Ig-like domain-containing protein [Gammaproteobacteria bacterium]|nr:Ig-like domain-containing protein [Gammaproteobacteria bacterium]